MDRNQETTETWNKIASLYEIHFMDLALYNDTYDIFCNQVGHVNTNIFEIGCGPGNITKYLLSKRPDFNVFGIDIASNMVQLARKNNPTAHFQVMDSRKISELNKKFSGVICGFCLPYLSKTDCTQLIEDCKSLLINHGILYLSFVEGDYRKSGYLSGSSGDRVYFYYHDLNKLKDVLIKNNFIILNLMKKNYHKKDGTEEVHTILLAKLNKEQSESQ